MKVKIEIGWIGWSFIFMLANWVAGFSGYVLRDIVAIRAALTIVQFILLVAQIYCVYRMFKETKDGRH